MAPNKAADGVLGQIMVYPNVGATVLAEVFIIGEAVTDGSVVGAFVGDELRGEHEVVLADGRSYVAINVNLQEAEKVSFWIWDAGRDREYGVAKRMTLEMGEMYGSTHEMVCLTLDAQPLARGFGLSRDSMRLVVAPELLGDYKVQRSKDLIHWEEQPISQEGRETGLTIDPDQPHEFYRLIRH